jgi:hypothetical protein
MVTKQANQEAPKPRKSITCYSSADPDEAGRAFASILTSPEFAAHRIINIVQSKPLAEDIDVPGMLAVLRDQAAAANRGDMAHAEAMLMNQATALQSLFVRLTERGMDQSHMPNLEGLMRLALRAQNQCRATLETLSAIKNPPVIYARQVNQTTGPQQINNSPSQARRLEDEQSKQARTGALLPDCRTSAVDGAAGAALETLGEIDRADNPRR